MLDFIKTIRENLKDPKKKAITQLVLYVIFFAIVFMLLANANDNYTPYVGNDNNSNEITEYNYVININENNIITNITGIYSNEKETFSYNNTEYNISDIINNVIENPVKYLVSDYYYDNIKKLINKSEFIKTTTYKDDSKETTYNIKVSDYFINSNYECINNCDNVIVITVYEKEYIDNVVIDLTSVNNYNYLIDIKYENIISK